MRKLYLTIGIKATESGIEVGGLRKLDINDLIDKYPEVTKSPLGYRPAAILKYLDDSQGHLLIANAIDSIQDYFTLIEGLKERHIKVVQFFVKIPSFTEAELDMMHGGISTRNLDFTRSELGQLSEAHQSRMREMIERMKAEGDEITIIV